MRHAAAEELGHQPRWGRVIGVIVVLVLLGCSSANPFLGVAVDDRLADRCPGKAGEIQVDRGSLFPVLWTCTVQLDDGTSETHRAFP